MLAALLLVQGNGFGDERQGHDFDPGLEIGLLLGYRWRFLTPFLEVRLAGWPRSQRVRVGGIAAAYELPRLDLLTSVGFAIGR
jgi:hypothetical protein